MRLCEILLVMAAAAVLAARSGGAWKPGWARMAPALVVSLLGLVQLILERFRWQMIPAYAAVAGLLLIEAVLWRGAVRLPWVLSSAIGALLLTAVTLSTIYPVFKLPKPTGPYGIGTVTYHFSDPNRAETYAPGHREVMAQVWYPASSSPEGKGEAYRQRSATTFLNSYLALVQTHAVPGAAVAAGDGAYPVLFFSPSWHGVRNQNMSQVEYLVSHGFVVVGVDHPYGSARVVFPDGRVVEARADKFLDTASEQSLKSSLLSVQKEVHLRAGDLVLVLDRLHQLQEEGQLGTLPGRLDLNRVGVFGYSFGGAVAAQACWMDHRFKAAADLDGMLFGEASVEGIDQPLLVITDSLDAMPTHGAAPTSAYDRWIEVANGESGMMRRDLERQGDYLVEIANVGHGNFSDTAWTSPARRLSDRGSTDRQRVMDIINEYSLAFFETTLKGTAEPLLKRKGSPFSEVKFVAQVQP